MRLSQLYYKTYKENPADAEINSHKLLVRGGFIKKQAAGSYIYMPLGIKVLQKIENVVREEMNKSGAHEVLMPMLIQEDVYENRIKNFGSTMFRLKDRNGKGMCLGPTHEELFTQLVKDTVTSYKNLPVNLYQIGTKFRDEIRPRFGLQRAREFIMKDAYSYDRDLPGLEKSFEIMKQTYKNIFDRLNLKYVVVDADNGAMGGFGSNEFMVLSDIGEDEIAVCKHCDYGANMEKAPVIFKQHELTEQKLEKQLVKTPNVKTIADVADFLKLGQDKLVKAVVYSYDKGIVVAYLRGDREIEEVKLTNYLKTINLQLATPEELVKYGLVAGYVGPTLNFNKSIKIVADNEIKNMQNFVMGGNETDAHYINCNLEDFGNAEFLDLRKIVANDMCPVCGGEIEIVRGIEVGHIFKLGTHYTKILNSTYLDENGKEQLMYMGCYGIGVSRTLSAVVEQGADEFGIVWPSELAPYKATIFAANSKDELQVKLAEEIYENLVAKHDVVLDDRKESYGVKMKDSQLIGAEYAIIAGRQSAEGLFEVVERKTKETKILTKEELLKLF